MEIFIRGAKLRHSLFRYSPFPIRLARKRKPGPTGPGSVRRRGGADDYLPEGNCCLHCGCHLGGWGNRLASQHHDYARREHDAQRNALHVSHAKRVRGISGIYADYTRVRCGDASRDYAANRIAFARDERSSEIPALRVGDKKIAKSLHTCDAFKLFRVNKIGIERHSLGLAEQLHESAVLLDQIIRQHRYTEAALAGAQNAENVVDN